jgi:6-phosphofructokinase 1
MTAAAHHRPFPPASALAIDTLGAPRHASPLCTRAEAFADEDDRVLVVSTMAEIAPYLSRREPPPSFEPAGPRERIFFDPTTLACGIVTCGGLCPGLNDVVRSIVLRLHYAYGVRRILGFRYGYTGLVPRHGYAPVDLTPAAVEAIHEQGGTLLGSSRGPQDLGEMVESLVGHGIGVLFVLGGDGGLAGASAIAAEIRRRGLEIGVIGLPKTIDNDLRWTSRSFGFATAVEEARKTIRAAHVEARAAANGIGLVKLMGRHAGFIAAHATLASSDVNFCLVPEVPLMLDGAGGFLDALERRLREKSHAVVVVAEGVGQDLLRASAGVPARDPSGNVKLADIGPFLRDAIERHFAERRIPIAIRYFDPSYSIRSQPTNATDAQYCLALGQHAVHAGLAGRTDMVVGYWNGSFVHVPIPLVTAGRRQLDPDGEEWQRVLESTGQGASLRCR